MNPLFVTVNCSRIGGSGMQMHLLAESLREIGKRAYVLHRFNQGVKSSEELRTNCSAFEFCEPYSANSGIIGELALGNSCDVVIPHISALGSVLAGLRGTSLPVIVYHGHSDQIPEGLKAQLNSNRVAAAVSIAHAGQAFLQQAVPDLPVFLIRQGTRALTNEDEDMRIREKIRPDSKLILCLASDRPYKNLDLFHNSMEILAELVPNTIGTVVGERSLRECQRRANRLGLKLYKELDAWRIGATHIIGPSSFPGSWIRRANVVVISSTSYEGIPGALREAMLLGTPVVTTDVGYVRELVRDGWNGFVVKRDDAEGLAFAIARALGGRSEIERMRSRGSLFVRLFFNERKRTSAYLAMWDRVSH